MRKTLEIGQGNQTVILDAGLRQVFDRSKVGC